ncbi:response regulator [Elusimicrobiota bacterium]
MYKILAVDDDVRLLQVLKTILENNDYEPILCENGTLAVELIQEHSPDLVLLDLALPDIDGTEICDILRKQDSTKAIPVIMLTGRSSQEEKVYGLKVGSDDYITKPFSPAELLARIKSVLRRSYLDENIKEIIENGGIKIDINEYTVTVDGEIVELARKEFNLLLTLMENEDKILTKQFLLDNIWGYNETVETKTLDIHISRLRNKLGENAAKHIRTIRGKGYRFSIL